MKKKKYIKAKTFFKIIGAPLLSQKNSRVSHFAPNFPARYNVTNRGLKATATIAMTIKASRKKNSRKNKKKTARKEADRAGAKRGERSESRRNGRAPRRGSFFIILPARTFVNCTADKQTATVRAARATERNDRASERRAPIMPMPTFNNRGAGERYTVSRSAHAQPAPAARQYL